MGPSDSGKTTLTFQLNITNGVINKPIYKKKPKEHTYGKSILGIQKQVILFDTPSFPKRIKNVVTGISCVSLYKLYYYFITNN